MRIYKNGVEVDSYTSEYGNRKIVIAIDSSKSNTAMSVWDSTGVFLDDYEISGAGGDVEIYQHCWNMRTALKELFKNADIIDVGLEDIITKNEKGYKGLQIHQSRAKITAVFDSLICFFIHPFNIYLLRPICMPRPLPGTREIEMGKTAPLFSTLIELTP